ncbi:50S ribosomal protein L30 [Candidatus Bathyarchaeota archaeon]|nr:MAG: 50S ribosomal protein L30 [Candidatus Bathyarchaeota archaeon]RLI32844.1 MAG: 50S ribosomal protein L30 [Candidatus Bathyarchaeota archaeon]
MERKCLLAIRIRSAIDATKEVKDTLEMLRLGRTNYATLLDDRPSYLGMLRRVKDRVTWGEVSYETILRLLKERGETVGGRKIDEETLKQLGYESLEELARALYNCEVELTKLKGIKPFFRLHPPKKGFKKKIKRPYGAGGETGYRGEEINKLALRMI